MKCLLRFGCVLSFILCLVVNLVVNSPKASAQDEMMLIRVEGFSKAESEPEAERAIRQSMIQSIARQQILDIIGEKSFQKNKNLIENRIIREAFKFIPFVTVGKAVKGVDGWRMPVQMKVSVSSLREMIISNGLLFDTEGPAAILPMVAISDRIRSQNHRWWVIERDESKKFLPQLSSDLNQALFRELNRQGFYVIRPQTQSLAGLLPESFRSDRPRPEDLRFLGDFFNAQMIVRGDVRLRESIAVSGGYQIAIKMSAMQAANNRAVAEVARNYETDPGNLETVVRNRLQTALPEVAKDLAVQVVDAWQKGTLGSNLLRLSLRGLLSPRQVNEFKAGLLKNVREVKSVRERIIEPGGITFEVDYAGGGQQFSERFRSLALPGFALKLASKSDTSVTLDIKAQ
jgi:hypothetical protein